MGVQTRCSRNGRSRGMELQDSKCKRGKMPQGLVDAADLHSFLFSGKCLQQRRKHTQKGIKECQEVSSSCGGQHNCRQSLQILIRRQGKGKMAVLLHHLLEMRRRTSPHDYKLRGHLRGHLQERQRGRPWHARLLAPFCVKGSGNIRPSIQDGNACVYSAAERIDRINNIINK